MSAELTMAGAALSTGVLAISVRTWWKGGRDIKAALPVAGGLVQGTSWTLCTGGLLGVVAVRTADAGNAGGDAALDKITGQSGGALEGGELGTLTPEGACVVVIMLLLGIVAWKAAGAKDRKRIVAGLFVGMTLTYTAGVAHLMQWVPDAYNSAGGWMRDSLNGVSPL